MNGLMDLCPLCVYSVAFCIDLFGRECEKWKKCGHIFGLFAPICLPIYQEI
jgi:hypothetical protein